MKRHIFKLTLVFSIICIITNVSNRTKISAAELFDKEKIQSEGILTSSPNATLKTQKYQIGDYIDGMEVIDVQYVSTSSNSLVNPSNIKTNLLNIVRPDMTTQGIFTPEYRYENYRSYILEGELESINKFPAGTPKWTYTVEDNYTVQTGLGVKTKDLETTFSITIGKSITRQIEWTGAYQSNNFALLIHPVFTHIFADLYEDDVWNDDYLGEVWFYRISGYNIYIVK